MVSMDSRILWIIQGDAFKMLVMFDERHSLSLSLSLKSKEKNEKKKNQKE